MPHKNTMADIIEVKASERAFDIAELRDEILRHLPAQALLVLQRVNKSWRTSIHTTSSIDFRTKCFFDISPIDNVRSQEKRRLNTLILRRRDFTSFYNPSIMLESGVPIGCWYMPERVDNDGTGKGPYNWLVFEIEQHQMHATVPHDTRYDMHFIESGVNNEINVRDWEQCEWKDATIHMKPATFGEMVRVAQKLRRWVDHKQMGFGENVIFGEEPVGDTWKIWFTKAERQKLVGKPRIRWHL